MTASPPISVVVPTYNNADVVAQTLESIIRQSFGDFELIISDHASTDDTWDIVSTYSDDPRVRLLRTERGGGAQRNWNRVTDEARGHWVKLVCGDDLLHPTCLEQQLAAAQANPGVSVVSCRRDIIDANSQILLRNRGLPGLAGRVPAASAVRANVRSGGNIFGEPACALMDRDVVHAVGGWSTTAEYLIDADLYVRVLGHGDLYALPTSLAAFRVSATQWSVTLATDQARQTADFYRQVAADMPHAVTPADLRRGIAGAYGAAVGRRLAYLWWSRRMRTSRDG
jgi:glycosyltransferase involved in cell wall biosynthesis